MKGLVAHMKDLPGFSMEKYLLLLLLLLLYGLTRIQKGHYDLISFIRRAPGSGALRQDQVTRQGTPHRELSPSAAPNQGSH